MLRSESPQIFARTDVSTKKRVIRALETIRFGGTPAAGGAGSARINKNFPQIDPVIIYVVWDRRELRARIEKRLYERLAAGLVEETARLLDSGVDAARFALFGMEYKHAARHIRGEATREEMAAQLLRDIFHLAKRQDTWFRGMERRGMEVHRVPGAEPEAALRICRGLLRTAAGGA